MKPNMKLKDNRAALRLRRIPANTVVHTPTEAEAKERVGYAMLNSVVRIGTYANENHIIDDVTEKVERIFES